VFLAASGALIAFLALASYFTLAQRWPDLRDSGVPNVVAAALGVALCLAAAQRAFRARRFRVTSALAASLGGLVFAFLAAYIFYISYRLPPAGGVAAAGTKAPAFKLQDQEGRERTLEEFQGRPVFLVFFRGHW